MRESRMVKWQRYKNEHKTEFSLNISKGFLIAHFNKMMERLGDTENRVVEKYKCVFSDSLTTIPGLYEQ